MKIRKLLVYSLLVLCFVCTKNVYADSKSCTSKNYFSKEQAEKYLKSVELHDSSKTTYTIGEKVYVDIYGETRDTTVTMSVTLRKVKDKSKSYTTWLKNIVGTDEDKGQAYFIIPDFVDPGEEYEVWFYTYYKQTNEVDYYYTNSNGEKMPYYKEHCGTFMPVESEAVAWNGFYLPNSISKFNIVEKEEEGPKEILESIEFKETTAYFGGSIPFTLKTKEPISSIKITFFNDNALNLAVFSKYMFFNDDLTSHDVDMQLPPYNEKSFFADTYSVEYIEIYDKQGNLTTYITNNRVYLQDREYLRYELDYKVKIEEPASNMIGEGLFEVKGLKIEKDSAAIGEKLYINPDFNYDKSLYELQSVLLTFYNQDSNSVFSTYLKLYSKDSYIIVPSSAKEGTYKLSSVVVTVKESSGKTNQIIINNPNLYPEIFNQKLTVTKAPESDEGSNVLYFSADFLDDEAYKIIDESNSNAIITINAGSQSVIPAKLFDLIQDTTRQLIIESDGNEWVFNGVDIDEIKPLNISMKLDNLDDIQLSDQIKKAFGGDAMAITFPNNGRLPGKALIRIKDDTLFNRMPKDNYYVYYVDQNGNKLNRVATEVQKSNNGYVEFYINHNSTYIISNEELTDDKLLGEDEEIMKVNSPNALPVSQNSNTTMIIIISVISAVVVLGLAGLVISSKKKTKVVQEKQQQ